MARPGVTVGGALQRFRPVTDLSVTGPKDTVVRRVVIDTGADEIILPEDDALTCGVDLGNAPSGISQGIGSQAWAVRYATVFLRLSDGHEFRTWRAIVGFTPALRHYGLFGIAQGLQYFLAVFDGQREEVSLEVNSAYPGT